MTLARLLVFFRLGSNAEDPRVAMESVSRNVVFRGTNLLILVFAIVIASVGLNMNSAAVIIGAMLISPLMGPIVGVGAGLGVMDLPLVRRALYNLGFAVAASLATSALYFLISPLSDAHSEILARTSPTIWDVLIALAGGFAGIIATASKERGNVVPGVAIATALMPPLCTAGYGLAHLKWDFFAGAFYLFLINSVFIAMAALFTVRWLRYPAVELADAAITARVRRITTALVIATVVPSIYLAYRLVAQKAFEHRAEQFVAFECAVPDNFLVQHTVDAKARTITLTYVGNGVDARAEQQLQQRLLVHDIADATLQIRTGLSIQDLNKEQRDRDAGLQRQMDEQRGLLARLGALTDSLAQVRHFQEQLLAEARAEHPTLQWLVIGEMPRGAGTPSAGMAVVSAHFSTHPDTAETARLDRWLRTKMGATRYVTAITTGSESGDIDRSTPPQPHDQRSAHHHQ